MAKKVGGYMKYRAPFENLILEEYDVGDGV